MITNMARPVHLVLAAAATVAVLVIFASPLTDILPAPQFKQAPAADLFASVLLLAFCLVFRLTWPVASSQPATEIGQSTSARLELICTLRC
ncbi:MAG TPA: hypothetical protein VD837_11730 [Terriglobales bacterium]|nr:hypothetical protein [Terriglobales bacterium]